MVLPIVNFYSICFKTHNIHIEKEQAGPLIADLVRSIASNEQVAKIT